MLPGIDEAGRSAPVENENDPGPGQALKGAKLAHERRPVGGIPMISGVKAAQQVVAVDEISHVIRAASAFSGRRRDESGDGRRLGRNPDRR